MNLILNLNININCIFEKNDKHTDWAQNSKDINK